MPSSHKRRPRDSAGLPIGVIIIITLLIGLGLGAFVYHLIQSHTITKPTPAPTPKPITSPLPPPPTKPKGPAPGLPAATQFNFYTILPEIHHRATHGVFPHAHATPTPVTTQPTSSYPVGGRYILQAASFPDPTDANKLRARLALHGLSSYIEKVSIAGRGAFYRVRIGPIHSRALARERHTLMRLGLKPLVLREARGN